VLRAQAVFGVTAVIMPGVTLGDGAVLGAIAAADVGAELAGATLHMGVPAIPTTKHAAGARALLPPICSSTAWLHYHC
jgi:acetyltransferase-like isoleucine patch superfamily enzyme